MAKISLIGAGSVVFSKQLMVDVMSFPELEDCTFCLMDIDPVRLTLIEKVANMLAAQKKHKTTIETTTDIPTAVKGADYVICLVQVGGFPAALKDFEIPARYGLKQTIADTTGVGGVFRALRTFPVLDEICRAIEDFNPNAMLLNYTNPMAMLSLYTLKKYHGVRYVGLCHSVQTTTKQLAMYMNIPYGDLQVKVAGINHQAWFLELKHNGRDCYPILFDLKDRIDEDPQFVPQYLHDYGGGDSWLRENFKKNAVETFSVDKIRFELMKRLGYYVTESSEHNAEYCAYFLKDQALIDRFRIPVNEYIRRCKIILKEFDSTKQLIEKGEELHVDTSQEYAGVIIRSMETGANCTINGNVLNTGLIPNLPNRCCVEVPCLINHNGVQPVYFGDLPPQLAAYNTTNVNVHMLAVEAGLEKKKQYAYHAVMLDPLASSMLNLEQMWSMTDDLFAAHQDVIAYLY